MELDFEQAFEDRVVVLEHMLVVVGSAVVGMVVVGMAVVGMVVVDKVVVGMVAEGKVVVDKVVVDKVDEGIVAVDKVVGHMVVEDNRVVGPDIVEVDKVGVDMNSEDLTFFYNILLFL